MELGAAEQAVINKVNVQSLLNTLTNLRAVRWLGGPTPPQAFEKPQLTVMFTTSPDDKQAQPSSLAARRAKACGTAALKAATACS